MSLADRRLCHTLTAEHGTDGRFGWQSALRAYRGEILELNDDILLIDGDVEHLILQKEQQLIIGRTLEKLRETDRKIFIMYYYRYKKIEEIAETLKMNPQTVKTRLRRGRETLKRILLEEGYDASEV